MSPTPNINPIAEPRAVFFEVYWALNWSQTKRAQQTVLNYKQKQSSLAFVFSFVVHGELVNWARSNLLMVTHQKVVLRCTA